MFTEPTKITSRKIILSTIVALASAVLTGCQTYPYSKLENDVYNCVDKLSREIPKEFKSETVNIMGNTQGYFYGDPSFTELTRFNKDREITPTAGKGRYVKCQLWDCFKELSAGYLNADDLWEEFELKDKSKLKKDSFTNFYFRGSTAELEGLPADAVIDTDVIVLQKPTHAVVYFRKVKSEIWEKCEVHGPMYFAYSDTDDVPEYCVDGAKIVPKGQVQRYLDLLKRFHKTYSFPEYLD